MVDRALRPRVYPFARVCYDPGRVRGEARVKSQFRAAAAAVMVVGCLLGLAGCGGSAAKSGKAPKPEATSAGKASKSEPIHAGIAAGDAALARGDRNEAGRLYVQALQSGADAATAHTRLGDLYLGSGAYAQALDAYEQAVKANRQYAPALQGIGFALYLGGGKGQAGQFLAKALALDPSLSRSAALLGTIENRDGRPETALAVSEASLAVVFDADVENNRGISLMLLGRGEEAAAAFHKAASAKKSVKFSNNLGLALCRLGRYDEAYAAFAGVATESAALNNLGVCYMETGNKAKAQEYFEKAIAANPRFYPQAHDNLTRLSTMEEVTLPVVPQALPAGAAQPAAPTTPVIGQGHTPPAAPAPTAHQPAAPAQSVSGQGQPRPAAAKAATKPAADKPAAKPAPATPAAAPAQPAPVQTPASPPAQGATPAAPAAPAIPDAAPAKIDAAPATPSAAVKPDAVPATPSAPAKTDAAKTDAAKADPAKTGAAQPKPAAVQEPKPFTPQPAPAGEAAPTPAKSPAKAPAKHRPAAAEKLDRSELP